MFVVGYTPGGAPCGSIERIDGGREVTEFGDGDDEPF
jgi:hypothetical protein